MGVPLRYFVHPEDQAALESLKSIPLFTPCVQAFMKFLPERVFHVMNMAQKIRLGPQQLPEIYQHLPVACETLGIPEPEFYLEMNPAPNAYTFGDTQIFVTVTSGLIEHMEEDEVRAVIAHECGHIACHHTLYYTMATLLVQIGSRIFGPLAAMSLPVQLALLYWQRRSELSADRAAAVVMKGSQSVVDTMIRLAGGPKSITEKINVDLYIQQADAFDKMQESTWDRILQGLTIMQQSHPFLSVRTREIINWCQTEQFQMIVQGLTGEAGPQCPSCQKPVKEDWKFCRHCGAPNPAVPAASDGKEATHE